MDDAAIIDFHAHLPPGEVALKRLLKVMDDHGIGRSVIVAGGVVDPDRLSRQLSEGGYVDHDADNEAVLRSCERSDGRLVPFYFANPHSDADAYRSAAASFAGLKLAPGVHGLPLDHPGNVALVRAATELGHPVYLHCVSLPGRTVADLVALARRWPRTVFVLGHAGVTHLDWRAVDLIAPLPNVLLETSGGYSSVVGVAIRRLGADRVLFGTEYPLQHPSVELAKLHVLDLTPTEWSLVTRLNAQRILPEAIPC